MVGDLSFRIQCQKGLFFLRFSMAGSAEKRPREAAGFPPGEGRSSKRRRWDADKEETAHNPPPVAPLEGSVAQGSAAAGTSKTSKSALPTSDALAKAKAVLAKQKALAEKLKAANVGSMGLKGKEQESTINSATAPVNTKQSVAVRRALEVAASAKRKRETAAATAVGSSAPRALRLNAAGQEIDEDGNIIVTTAKEISTFKINAKKAEEVKKQSKFEAFAALERETAAEVFRGGGDDVHVDPRMTSGRRRNRTEFQVR